MTNRVRGRQSEWPRDASEAELRQCEYGVGRPHEEKVEECAQKDRSPTVFNLKMAQLR